jgi:CBS domain-containing membrane protein
MTCAEIMTPDPITVRDDEPLSRAIEILRDNRFRSVPVVDANGVMLGQFGIHALLALIVPKAAMMNGGSLNFAFINDDFDDLQRRLVEERDQPVGRFAKKDAVVLHPDTALTHVVLNLYNCHNNLPVVERKTGKLVGIVSYWDIVGRLLEVPQ